MTKRKIKITKDLQYFKFCSYGFFKNLRLFEPFLILFFLSNGLSFFQIGLVYTTREITRNVFEIPSGIIADSMGRRRTMMASFSFYIVSFLILFVGHDFSVFLVAMFVYALGDAFRTGTHKAMIFDYLKIKGRENQKTHYYGHTRSFSQLGSAISSLLGGAMVFYTGNYRDIFFFTAVPYIIELVLIASYPKTLDGLRAKFSHQKMTDNFILVSQGFAQSFSRPQTLKNMGNLSLHTGFYKAIKDYLQPVLQTLALSAPVLLMYSDKQRTAVIVGITYFVIYLFTSLSSRRSGSFRALFRNAATPLNLTLLGGLVAGLLSGLFIHLSFVFFAVFFYILIFMNENLRKPIGIANIAEKSNKDFLATTLSAESQLNAFITAILAPVIGWIADTHGLGNALMSTSLVLMVFAMLVFLRSNRRKAKLMDGNTAQ